MWCKPLDRQRGHARRETRRDLADDPAVRSRGARRDDRFATYTARAIGGRRERDRFDATNRPHADGEQDVLEVLVRERQRESFAQRDRIRDGCLREQPCDSSPLSGGAVHIAASSTESVVAPGPRSACERAESRQRRFRGKPSGAAMRMHTGTAEERPVLVAGDDEMDLFALRCGQCSSRPRPRRGRDSSAERPRERFIQGRSRAEGDHFEVAHRLGLVEATQRRGHPRVAIGTSRSDPQYSVQGGCAASDD